MSSGPAPARHTRTAALLTWALVALATAWSSLAGGVNGAALTTLLLLWLPLALPLGGLWRAERRSYAWATLCLMPVLVFAATESIANPAARAPAALLLFFALLAFVALVAHLRATRAD